MKQIEFTLEAFGPDGLLKEGYEVRYNGCEVDFIKRYSNGSISGITEFCELFYVYPIDVNGPPFTLYLRTRTAEEVAMEVAGEYWDDLSHDEKIIRKIHVQAGMDEMTKP